MTIITLKPHSCNDDYERKQSCLGISIGKLKSFCPLVINLEQKNCDLQRKPLDSQEELRVTSSGSVH